MTSARAGGLFLGHPAGRRRTAVTHTSTDTRFAAVWALLDQQATDGRFPGCVAAVRHAGRTEVHATGRLAVGGGDPMRPDTLFRVASLSKPFGGVLTLGLVHDGVLRLADDVTRWLPEFTDLRVLVDPAGPLTGTVPAERSITVGDLLFMTAGFGLRMEPSPLAQAMFELGVSPGPFGPTITPDEFLTRLAGLPLAAQPGAGWQYHTGSDVLGVLVTRATGRSLGDLLAERVTGPLGLTDTTFWTPHVDRLATSYAPGEDGLQVADPPDGAFARPRQFESLGGGLLSTAPDVLALLAALADGGAPVLDPASTRQLTSDRLTAGQRASAQTFLGPGRSWGGNVEVVLEPTDPWATRGRFGWSGGTGTTAYADPELDLVAVLLTQRMMTGPHDGPEPFWQAAHDAVAAG
jgi:CubicO group peptidase (beta-lactamase class C family)